MDQNKKITSVAIIIMSANIISRLTGYLRTALLTNKMGFDEGYDAFTIAYLIPDLMFQLLVGGAIAAALIPVLSSMIGAGKEEEGWKAATTFLNIVLILMVLFCFFGMIFTPQLLPLVAAGYKADINVDLTLVIKLTRIMFPSVAFLMLAAFCNGVLNSYHKFTVAAFGPVLYNVGFIISILIFAGQNKEDIIKVAYGVLISSFSYFLFQFVSAIKHFKYYKWKFYLSNSTFRRLIKIAIPALISSSIVQINIVISKSFATYLEDGRVAMLHTADRTWQLPIGIFTQSLAVAMLPTLSILYKQKKLKEYDNLLNTTYKTVMFLIIPSTFGMIALSQPISKVLFDWSDLLSTEDIKLTGVLLVIYSVALIYYSTNLILNRAFYTIGDSKTPLYTGVIGMVVNYILNHILLRKTDLDVSGMALAFVISVAINAILLIYLYYKKTSINLITQNLSFFIKTFFASAMMTVVLLLLNKRFTIIEMSQMKIILLLFFEVIVGVVIYLITNILVKNKQLVILIRQIIKKK